MSEIMDNIEENQNRREKMENEFPEGIIEMNKSGFAFVRQDDGNDIFIAAENMNSAMHGDRVRIDLLPEHLWGKNKEGIVDRVLERANQTIVGRMDKRNSYGFVIPDNVRINRDIFVSKANLRGAEDGDTVMVKITKFPDKRREAEGFVAEIISKKNQPGGDLKALYRSYGLLETFPSRANAEAKARAKEEFTQDVLEGRTDLRDQLIVTIDGADSKDLDDGVSVERLENGNYLLGVHIADVSHYVEAEGYLDKEAQKRGNSVYLPGTVIPMLPKTLSNGICSLNPGVDRLALSCTMEINGKGDVVNHRIFESIINSKERLVYDDVSDILECHNEPLMEKYSHITDQLFIMEELASILRKKRKKDGSLDFDIDEAKVILDNKGRTSDVVIEERRTANRLIEEFMLAANRTVAEHFYWMELPFIYRVHEKPDAERMMELKAFLFGFGISLKGSPDNMHPGILNAILEDIKGEEYESIVGSVILRSMKKAFYSTDCQGHFGLACQYYCHFTSPIRRYPDLFIHRVIKMVLHGEMSVEAEKKLAKTAETMAEQSSVTERQAQELERAAVKMKMAEYMQKYEGRRFDGVISGVTNFGIYVQLPNTIEGMVPLNSMKDDYYIFEKEQYRVMGERTKKIYSLGDKVRIRVLNANPRERIIDFALEDGGQKKKKSGSRAGSRNSSRKRKRK